MAGCGDVSGIDDFSVNEDWILDFSVDIPLRILTSWLTQHYHFQPCPAYFLLAASFLASLASGV